MFEDMLEDEEIDAFMEEAEADHDAVEGLQPAAHSSLCLGHQEIEDTLLSYINAGSVPHALIFSGAQGIGKSTMAYRFARYLLKHGTQDPNQDSLFGDTQNADASTLDVSSEDPVFRMVASGGHPDFMAVQRAEDERKGGLKETLDVETIRKITPFLRMTAATQGGWRVVIIDDADTMNRNAQNGLLKILEEPPARTVLILITHRIGAMIPTIRSRCRVLNFMPLAPEILQTLLEKQTSGLSAPEMQRITAMADGSIGRAADLVDNGGLEAVQDVLKLFEDWPKWNWTSIHLLAEKLGRAGNAQAYNGFVFAFNWIMGQIVVDKAKNRTDLSILYDAPALKAFQDHYSLGQVSGFYEKLQTHFEQADRANLDKKQTVLGAFSVFE